MKYVIKHDSVYTFSKGQVIDESKIPNEGFKAHWLKVGAIAEQAEQASAPQPSDQATSDPFVDHTKPNA